MKERMMDLTRKMVQIKSVNHTSGEKEIGVFLESYLRSIPYFKKHPNQVFIQPLKDDPLERRNVMALLIGEKERRKETLLFHGHTDTVGTEDYGKLSDAACDPDRLMECLKEMELPEEVREDLLSGDYLFGRGACDMKSGDAVFAVILEELSKHPEKLGGNILVSFNPVEENLHTGILEGLDLLQKIKETYGLEYLLAINNDYICPLFPGDNIKTIYTGTVGKILPCFYIQGRETHVGQCFEGFDASLAAAKLVEKISLNCEFCDGYEGEYSLPPSVLKMKDLKPWYNVQTACEAFVYFNYFVHNSGMEEITAKLIKVAKAAMEEVLAQQKEQAKRFGRLSGQEQSGYPHSYQVYTYEELVKNVLEKGVFTEDALNLEIERIAKEEEAKNTDKREIPIAILRKLLELTGKKDPTVVLYYAAPYCPHNTLQGSDAHYIQEIQKIAGQVGERMGEQYRMMKFFPSLSDSSYLKLDDSRESLECLVSNFPAFRRLYPVPVEKIRNLNIPAVNYGCYGKDAHKWTERVNIPYTFEVLPQLILETVRFYLELEQ